jgi:mannitol-1-/sugar-/sorbitol-6-phosphatase
VLDDDDSRPLGACQADRVTLTIDPTTTAAALFDMDGTLVDSSAAVEISWTEFAERHGLDAAELLAHIHGVRAVDTIARFVPSADVAAETTILLDREMALVDRVTAIPGAIELLRALPEAGIPTAIVTSAPRDLALARLGAAGIPVPPVFVTGEDVEHGKPAPDCYQLAAERLGVDPAHCVVFEDADAGIRAGLAAGARVVVIGDLPSDAAADLTRIPDYREVTVA